MSTENQRNSEYRPVSPEDQWALYQRNSGNRGPMGTDDQKNRGHRGTEAQWVQRIRGRVGTGEQ